MDELLFKLMIQKDIIDTRATDTHLRENLTNLYIYMSTVSYYIENFNQYVKVIVYGLKARGGRTDDLRINLFKAYQVSTDSNFSIFIKTNIDKYYDV